MFKNYFITALRNLRKHKGYSAINIFGLAIGMACCILILLFVQHELSYDRFHENADQIYRVYKERITPTGTQETYDTWVPLALELTKTFPIIRKAARFYTDRLWVENEGQKFQELVSYADSSFFEMFTFKLKRGEKPFPTLNSAVISSQLGEKYFGGEDPIGRTIRIGFRQDYVVSGILQDMPQNSSIQLHIVVPIRSDPEYQRFAQNWQRSFLDTYVQLTDKTAAQKLEQQFPSFITKIWEADIARRTNFRVLPLTDMYNRFNNSYQYAYILLAIAFAILTIAGINFMNITTAHALPRVREIGVRKVLGAVRGQLIKQFLGEAILLTFMAFLVGICLAEILLPYFNALYDVRLSLNLFNSPLRISGFLILTLLLGTLSGCYPALFLSQLQAAESLKSKAENLKAGVPVRNALIVLQFVFSLVLIAGTLIVRQQVLFMKNAETGSDKEHVVVLPLELDDFAASPEAARQLALFKQTVAAHNVVASVSSSSNVPGSWPDRFTFARPEGWQDRNPARVRFAFVDHKFFDTYGIRFLEGRNFIEGSESDRRNALVVNEAALRDFGWESGAGKRITVGRNELQVMGVVSDYNFQSLQNAVMPVLHVFREPENGVHNFVSVRIRPGRISEALAMLERAWRNMDPSRAFEYFFVDDAFEQLYRTQDRLVTVAWAFSALAIVIACLGLLGLTPLMISQRTKEIGIRKVLGASVANVTALLSRDFVKLVLLANLIAVPVAWIAMNKWLQNFAYRIGIEWWVFALAGSLALVIALVTVSTQAVRAALANPVVSLRYE